MTTKLIITAIIAVAGLGTILLKTFWGKEAAKRKLTTLENELAEFQNKRRQAFLANNMDLFYTFDNKCIELSKNIARLRNQLGKD